MRTTIYRVIVSGAELAYFYSLLCAEAYAHQCKRNRNENITIRRGWKLKP